MKTTTQDRPTLTEGRAASDVQLLVWDFAGQAGYYAAQRLFLHPDQLVAVLCVDVRKWRVEGLHNILKDWLSGLCRGHGDGAQIPLIVVATHCDEVKDAHVEVQAVAGQLMTLLATEEFAGRVSLLQDGRSAVWLRKKDDAGFRERLLGTMVERSLASGSRLVSAGALATLARVQSNQIREGVTLLSHLGVLTAKELADLAQLRANGLIYYQPGALAVCTNITAPLEVFKSLLREQYVCCATVECLDTGWLWDSKVKLMIEHNEVWDKGANGPRFAIREAVVHPPVPELLQTPDGKALEFTITPRNAKPLTLRFVNTTNGKRFASCLEVNRLDEPAYLYSIQSTVVRDVLVKLYPHDPPICTMLRNVLLSCGVLVLNRVLRNEDGRPKVDPYGTPIVEYVMPYLFPRHPNTELLNWDSEIRHARKYVVDKRATLAQMQSVVLKLSGVMRGRTDTEHFWRDDDTLSVGAWQSSASRRTFFACRFDATLRHWYVYVLLAVGTKSESGLLPTIVQAHDAIHLWFSSEFQSSILPFLVATRPELAKPELIYREGELERFCGMTWSGDVAVNVVPLLLPERMRDAHRVSAADQQSALCLWCTSWTGPSKKVECQHSWLVLDEYVATAYVGGGGQGQVLAGHHVVTRALCAIKVCSQVACKQEVLAATRLEVLFLVSSLYHPHHR